MSVSLLKIARPSFSLLGSDTASIAVRARVVTRDEAATPRLTSPRPGSGAQIERSVDPMLAVYEARAETFRIAAAAVAQAWTTVGKVIRRAVQGPATRQTGQVAIPE
jgi:hypothetical protein